MADKIQNCASMVPEYVYEEIKNLQNNLSLRDEKLWTLSDTFNLLLHYVWDDEIECELKKSDLNFLKSYFEDKGSILDEFISYMLISSRIDDHRFC